MTNKKETYDQNKVGSDLSTIRNENSFQVPENYFDELPQVIQEKIYKKKVQFDIGNFIHHFVKPYRFIAIGSIVAIILLGLFLFTNQEQDDSQTSFYISFEELVQEYPDMMEYMDDQDLIEFVAAQMTQQDLYYFDYEFGFDSILLQNEVFQHLSDEEVSEIIYNL